MDMNRWLSPATYLHLNATPFSKRDSVQGWKGLQSLRHVLLLCGSRYEQKHLKVRKRRVQAWVEAMQVPTEQLNSDLLEELERSFVCHPIHSFPSLYVHM